MKLKRLVSLSALVIFMLPTLLQAGAKGAQWSYQGEEGPAHWGEISEDFQMCGDGRNQSPINLTDEVDAELPELVFDYDSSPNRVINNGHTIQVDIEPGSFLRIPARGLNFELKQFHFHSPSEHTIDGQSYAMELHLVHAAENGALAVVGVMIGEGRENSVLRKLKGLMPENAGQSNEVSVGIEETDLLPSTVDYYYYNGSLTTPPCSEGVTWLVLKASIEASAGQIALFKERVGPVTNRPVQPQNARLILE